MSDGEPPCPDCETDVLVGRSTSQNPDQYICYGCDLLFVEEAPGRARARARVENSVPRSLDRPDRRGR